MERGVKPKVMAMGSWLLEQKREKYQVRWSSCVGGDTQSTDCDTDGAILECLLHIARGLFASYAKYDASTGPGYAICMPT